MPDIFDLKIFHYHFLTGGVSTVVRQAVEAFRALLPAVRSVELSAGAIPEGFRSMMERYSAKCTETPELGYRRPEAADSGSVARRATGLADSLLRSFGSDDSVWWVHNHHLGKNVVFTQALLEIARSGRQRMILQIHDFPECGRFRNLALLRRALSLDPYPVVPWVRYAVVNRRDRDILIRGGVPGDSVFLLENPVFEEPGPPPRASAGITLRRLLGNSSPVLLYPVRAIRRKNALEAVLLCMLLKKEANLLITLPGLSDAERPYSELVQRIFAERLCPGLFGIGATLEQHGLGFRELVEASNMIVSTSVQEGFGYLFVNALLWSLPLAARKLDMLAGTEGLFAGFPACFYDGIRVPVLDAPSLLNAYRSKILDLSDLIGEAERDRLLEDVGTLVQDRWVDFSYLPVTEQERWLRRLAAYAASEGSRIGRAAFQGLRRRNRGALSRIADLIGSHKVEERAGVKEAEVRLRFGPAAYAAAFGRILESFGKAESPFTVRPGVGAAAIASAPGGVRQAVLKEFLRLENLRLLYDY
jgi:hypothetical protein